MDKNVFNCFAESQVFAIHPRAMNHKDAFYNLHSVSRTLQQLSFPIHSSFILAYMRARCWESASCGLPNHGATEGILTLNLFLVVSLDILPLHTESVKRKGMLPFELQAYSEGHLRYLYLQLYHS